MWQPGDKTCFNSFFAFNGNTHSCTPDFTSVRKRSCVRPIPSAHFGQSGHITVTLMTKTVCCGATCGHSSPLETEAYLKRAAPKDVIGIWRTIFAQRLPFQSSAG